MAIYLHIRETIVQSVERKEADEMEREFKLYRKCWIASVFFYSLVMFIKKSPIESFGFNMITGVFLLTVLGLMMQAIFMTSAYKKGKLNSVFYRLPMVRIGMTGLFGMGIITILIGLIPNFPLWFGAVICLIFAIGIALASSLAEKNASYLESVDEKIKDQTEFIQSMTIASESLMKRVQSEKIKKECKKVYEAFRYSDPMSTELILDEEERIREQFSKFVSSVKNEDLNLIKETSVEIQRLLEARNKRLRYMK